MSDGLVSRRDALVAVGAIGAVMATTGTSAAAEAEEYREPPALRSSAKLVWEIAGNDKPKANSCGDIPPTAYLITAAAANVVDAAVLHVIWHKTSKIPNAIDRVIIDTDVDHAANKTPHFSHLHSPPLQATLGGDPIFAICYFDFCSKGKYDINVTVVWEDVGKVVDSSGIERVNHRRFIDTKTFPIESQ